MKNIKLIKNHKIKFIHCHRKPDRTFKIRGNYFPICIRCTGIYVGTIFAFLFHYFVKMEYNLNIFLISLCLMIPMITDVATQVSKWRDGRNSIRFVTGLIGGVGYGIIILMLFLSIQKNLVGLL